MAAATQSISKFKLTRRGRKLQIYDDQRTILALPKDIPERTWAEILLKEEIHLMIFDIREQILDYALDICHEKYMEKQNTIFTAHCVAKAWLKIINWHFYRHDPGEDPSAYPPCYIPKRQESWTPDCLPDPSPKDTWGIHDLEVLETIRDEGLQKWSSATSLDYPHVEEIPSEYWFPGKVNLPEYNRSTQELFVENDLEPKIGRKEHPTVVTESSEVWNSVQESSLESRSEKIGTESEVLQKITNYGMEEDSKVSSLCALKTTTPVNGLLHGAGDSTVMRNKVRKLPEKSKALTKGGRSSKTLPPLELGANSRSRISIISDCRLRNLRLDTQFEVSSEKMNTPPGEIIKRK